MQTANSFKLKKNNKKRKEKSLSCGKIRFRGVDHNFEI